MKTLLTETEKKNVREGYLHMVDNGYSKLETMEDVLRLIGAHAEYMKREKLIGIKTNGAETDPVAKAVQDHMILLAEIIEKRLA